MYGTGLAGLELLVLANERAICVLINMEHKLINNMHTSLDPMF